MNNYKWILLLIALVMLSSLAIAEESAFNDCIYYFYGRGCDNCNSTNNYIAQLQEKYSNLQVNKVEVYYNGDNYEQLKSYFRAYGIAESSQGVPVVFTQTSYFIGEKSIVNLLENHLRENDNGVCPNLEQKQIIGVSGSSRPTTLFGSLTFSTVVRSAVNNYLSPGSLAILSVLLGIVVMLISLGKGKYNILKRSLMFILGIFIVYVLYGMGFLSWFAGQNVTFFAYKVIGVITVVLSLVMIRHLSGKKVWFEHKPHAAQKKFHKRMGILFSVLGTFIIGVITGLFSFAGLHKTFGWLRHLILQGNHLPTLAVILLYYLLIFILLPLVVSLLIFLVRESGEDSGEREQWLWKRKQLGVVNLVLSIILLGLGIILLIFY